MAKRKPPSAATLSLCATANRLGRRAHPDRWEPVTPRKVERWGQLELLLDPARPGLGRGAGRAVVHGPDAAARIVDVALLVREYRSTDAAALVLFARDERLPERTIKRAFRNVLRRGSRQLQALSEADDRDRIVVDAAATLAKRTRRDRTAAPMRRRLRGRRDHLTGQTEPIDGLLQGAYGALTSILLTGQPTSDEGLHELLTATGIAAAAEEHLPGAKPFVPDLPLDAISALTSEMKLTRATRRIQFATLDQLNHARDDARAFRDFSKAFSAFASRAHGLPDAMGLVAFADGNDLTISLAVPAMLTLHENTPTADWEIFEHLRECTPFFQAANFALDHVPDRYHRLFDGTFGTVSGTLPERDRHEIQAALQEAESKSPEAMALLVSGPPDFHRVGPA